jgi:hypothetical protein
MNKILTKLLGGCTTLLLASCVHVKGRDYQATFIATDAKRVRVSAEGVEFADLAQSTSVKHGTEAVTKMARVRAWFGLADTAAGELGDLGRKLTD